MNILDEIVEQKKLEVAKLPARIIAAGDLRKQKQLTDFFFGRIIPP